MMRSSLSARKESGGRKEGNSPHRQPAVRHKRIDSRDWRERLLDRQNLLGDPSGPLESVPRFVVASRDHLNASCSYGYSRQSMREWYEGKLRRHVFWGMIDSQYIKTNNEKWYKRREKPYGDVHQHSTQSPSHNSYIFRKPWSKTRTLPRHVWPGCRVTRNMDKRTESWIEVRKSSATRGVNKWYDALLTSTHLEVKYWSCKWQTNRKSNQKDTHISVAMYPGQMPFTCTLCWLHSLASDFVSCPRAPLAAAYAGTVIPPWKVRREHILMILPRFRGTMCWPAAWARIQHALRLTVITYRRKVQLVRAEKRSLGALASSQSFSGKSTEGLRRWMPAQLTKTCTSPPMASIARGKRPRTWSISSRSQWIIVADPPAAIIAL